MMCRVFNDPRIQPLSLLRRSSLPQAITCYIFVAILGFGRASPHFGILDIEPNLLHEDPSTTSFGRCRGDGFVRSLFMQSSQSMKPLAVAKIILMTGALPLVSCTMSEYPFGQISSPRGASTARNNYAGNAYYWNDRYYTGGCYETGRFQYLGRNYNNRYVIKGRFLYGGRLEYLPGFNPARSYESHQRYSNKHRYYQPFYHYH